MSTFTTFLLDPPWNEQGGGKIKRGADRHYPLLKTLDMPAVIRSSGLLNPSPAAHMYLWVTSNFLIDGLWLMGELGFTYKTNICWAKKRIGLGQYFRGKHELCLFGTYGKGFDARTESNSVPSLLETEDDEGQSGVDQMAEAVRAVVAPCPLTLYPNDEEGVNLAKALAVYDEGFAGYVEAEHVKVDGKRKHSGKPDVFYDLIESRSKGPYVEFFARSQRPGWTSFGNEVT